MNEQFANQELLPPLSEGPDTLRGWFDWLVDPLPSRFMLPATALLMLGLDWLLFSEEVATFGLAVPLTATTGFLAGALGTYHLQRKFARDNHSTALWKALLAGLFVGIPLPMAGTFVGAWVLATSGLVSLNNRFLSRNLFRK